MTRVEVEAALRAWREAAHEVETLPSDSPERSRAEIAAEERRLVYQRAVLGGRGRADALAAASESTADRLGRTHDLLERGRELALVRPLDPVPTAAPEDGRAGPASEPQAESSPPTSPG
jgi:hypothetical protein